MASGSECSAFSEDAEVYSLSSEFGESDEDTFEDEFCDEEMDENQPSPWEGTTDRRVRSDPPQCTTSRADRQIVRMAVKYRSVSSRTVAQHIQSNHKRLRRQWCVERRMWTGQWNEIVFTDESRFCVQHHDGRIRVWRHRGERSCTGYYGFHRRVEAKNSLQDDDVPIDDATTKPLFTPQDKGRKDRSRAKSKMEI
ncbi:hypothetical protein LAZ67_16002515 [Cordylochernes scorpioides]|uniref:Transposase Tc1-like domain-containing protein n=1 Tax=Cordylochernes scorpioides TaxID=51811 RepID=A0ABY6LCD6_9ARAC|nr:hypothetical protein LAZ67_16002515 [Cordylochernes scorpioides]